MDTLLKLNPGQAEIDRVVHPLVVHNTAFVGPSQFQPFIISLPSGGGDLVGMVDHDWLILQFLFIPERLRRQGHGRALLQRAESFARERDLVGLWSDSFGFQTPAFFEALGFSAVGTIDDHPRGSYRRFMQKRLDASLPS